MREYFPDGTPIDAWFYDTRIPTLAEMGKPFVLTDYGVRDDGKVYTEEIQNLIDRAAAEGGGVIVVPRGTYCTGALFFKQGVHLYLEKDAMLLGSDDVCDYPICDTRIEGESCRYLPALINVDGVDGFTMCGEGTVDGNGLRSWRAFWARRKWNRQCTNKDEQRARLVYISNSKNVTVAGLRLQNSQFWTNHLYRCERVKFLGCSIYSPNAPVPAPSTDAIDIDVCTDVLIKGCRMQVNDDSVVLKGGKGPWADEAPENGRNERILVEDCESVNCHGGLTCGSESIYNRNVLVRRMRISGLLHMLWLKMRPDTPQRYEYITVEDIEGTTKHLININPWTQFYDLKGREEIPLSYADHVTLRNCNCECEVYFGVKADREQYLLSNFVLEDIRVRAKEDGFSADKVDGVTVKNVTVELVD